MMTITHKITLEEANVMRRALEDYRAEQLRRIKLAGGLANAPAAGSEVGRIEILLRRDFSWSGGKP